MSCGRTDCPELRGTTGFAAASGRDRSRQRANPRGESGPGHVLHTGEPFARSSGVERMCDAGGSRNKVIRRSPTTDAMRAAVHVSSRGTVRGRAKARRSWTEQSGVSVRRLAPRASYRAMAVGLQYACIGDARGSTARTGSAWCRWGASVAWTVHGCREWSRWLSGEAQRCATAGDTRCDVECRRDADATIREERRVREPSYNGELSPLVRGAGWLELTALVAGQPAQVRMT